MKDRLEFKALAKGFSHKQVNPAYSSQVCPKCDYVDSKNRIGDRFKCLHCRHVSHADWVAAINHEARYYDCEITLYTPYKAVKEILVKRFHRRLETEQSGTVSGRTSASTMDPSTVCRSEERISKNVDAYVCP